MGDKGILGPVQGLSRICLGSVCPRSVWSLLVHDLCPGSVFSPGKGCLLVLGIRLSGGSFLPPGIRLFGGIMECFHIPLLGKNQVFSLYILLQEVWDDKDVNRIKEVLGDDFYLTDHLEFSPKCWDRKKRETFVKSGRSMSIPMFRCSGLLIASKHKTKVFSDFVEFEEYGSWPLDCISISQPDVRTPLP